MRFRIKSLTIGCIYGLALVAASLVPSAARAQNGSDDEDRRLSVNPPLNQTEKARLVQFHDGSQVFGSNPGDEALLERAAQWYVYRVTWPEYQQQRPPDGITLSAARSVYDILQSDLYPLLLFPNSQRRLRDSQIQFQTRLVKALLPPIDKVLHNPVPIARINAGIILSKLAETGKEEVMPALVGIMDDPKQLDAVKYHALAGMEKLFRYKNGPDGDPFADKSLEPLAIESIERFLTRPMPAAKDGVAPEDTDAFRYVRRQAVRALGQTKYPAYVDRKVVKSRAALDLVRILRKDGANPEPTMTEQLEAAIGLCQLKAGEYSGYQPDYSAYQIGQFILEFGDQYEKDRAKGTHTGLWRYDSNRLIQALATLDADSGGRGKVHQLVQQATGVLQQVQAGSQASRLVNLRTWLNGNPPPLKMLYQNDPSSAVKEG